AILLLQCAFIDQLALRIQIMRRLTRGISPIVGIIPVHLIEIRKPMLIDIVNRFLAPARMHNQPIKTMTNLGKIRPQTAHWTNHIRSLTLEYGDEASNLPFSQHLIDDIGLLQAVLRPSSR